MINTAHLKIHCTKGSLHKKRVVPRRIGRTNGALSLNLHLGRDALGLPLNLLN
ncbi:MAG: hypothetical protein ACJAW4_000770 [Paracoccaceae bacterium]|jgi:hypothetical protein